MEEKRPPRDIEERTFEFAVKVLRFTKAVGRKAGSCRSLLNQLLRSRTSIGANVEEAQGAQSRRDFISKMQIALKEARETVYWLRLLIRGDIATREQTAALLQEANELKCILGAIVVTAKRNEENRR